MRARKQGDSPSDYDREIRPRRRLFALRDHEDQIRRMADDRWRRRVQPVFPVPDPVEDPDFPGCVW